MCLPPHASLVRWSVIETIATFSSSPSRHRHFLQQFSLGPWVPLPWYEMCTHETSRTYATRVCVHVCVSVLLTTDSHLRRYYCAMQRFRRRVRFGVLYLGTYPYDRRAHNVSITYVFPAGRERKKGKKKPVKK